MNISSIKDTRRNKYRHAKPIAEINVTPFVDVMLVLLIIFMVTAPLLTTGIPINMPRGNVSNPSQQGQTVDITIDRQGQIFLQETPLALAELIEKLRAIKLTKPDLKIFLRGDQATDYGTVVAVASAIAESGFHNITLRTKPVGR